MKINDQRTPHVSAQLKDVAISEVFLYNATPHMKIPASVVDWANAVNLRNGTLITLKGNTPVDIEFEAELVLR